MEACIFQYHGGFYGPEYPDPKGSCAQAITEAQDIISDDYFGNQLQGLAISELYNAGVKNFTDFKVFLTGYAHFFNVDPDSTRCNNQSFGPIPGYRPKLSMELRKAINDLVEQVNNVYSGVVASMKNPNIQFVDISPGFKRPSLLRAKKMTTTTTRTTSRKATPGSGISTTSGRME